MKNISVPQKSWRISRRFLRSKLAGKSRNASSSRGEYPFDPTRSLSSALVALKIGRASVLLRSALRLSFASEIARIFIYGNSRSGARHRREFRSLQRGRCGVATRASVSRSGATRHALGKKCHPWPGYRGTRSRRANNFREWTKQVTQFESIGGFEDANLNLTSGPEPERIEGARASANLFEVLGVKPQLGTTFSLAESDSGRSRVVVISDRVFQKSLRRTKKRARSGAHLERSRLFDSRRLASGFHLPATREGTEQRKPDLFVPYDGSETHDNIEFNRRKMNVFGRLRENVSLEQARAEMDRDRKATRRTGRHAKRGLRSECLPGIRGRCRTGFAAQPARTCSPRSVSSCSSPARTLPT